MFINISFDNFVSNLRDKLPIDEHFTPLLFNYMQGLCKILSIVLLKENDKKFIV